ncbi:MAG: glucosamine inositolphosphorylceramide transferase family protein [Dokdonella sp.]|uniref:glucosamine inositolphosphorylceramide transferase family protein n=1 Tax=Dokdonella sp. TaxID=2291710 RepID=UPI003F7D0D06
MTQRADAAAPTPLYAPLPSGRRALRVAVLVDRAVVPAWIAETLAALAADDACELLAVLHVPLPPARSRYRAIDAFVRADAALAGAARKATAPVVLHERLREVPLQDADAREHDGCLVPGARSVSLLRALDADLLLGFGLPPPSEVLCALARHGAWFFERDATDARRHGLRHLDALRRGEAVSRGGVIVHDGRGWRLLGGDDWSATAQLSFARNRAWQLLRVPATLVRLVRRLAAGGTPAAEAAPAATPPGVLATCALALRLGVRAVRRHLPRLGRTEDWVLAARRTDTPLDPAQPDARALRVIATPSGCFWADPSLVRHGGRDWLFVEEYPYATRRGRIAVAELDDALAPIGVRTVFDEPWHLSYPLVYEWQGELWLTVESSAARTFALHRAVEFPARWAFAAELLRGRNAVDGTLHHDGTHWYLFACISESPLDVDRRVWTDLFLFVADSPLGPWRAHPANPLQSDVRRARPAGKLFMHEGRLVRPAQDCSVDYGYAVVFNEVVVLDPERYEERPLGRIEPDWLRGLRGCHTYSRGGGIEIVDGKRLVPRRRTRAARGEESR